MNLESAIDWYLADASARRLSETTIKQYNRTFKRLVDFVGDKEVDDISPNEVRKFINTFAHLKTSSVISIRLGLSALWTFMVDNEIAKVHVIKKIPQPRPDVVQVQPFTPSEIKLLFASLKKTSPFQRGDDSVLTQADARFPKRNRAMMTLMLDAGPRASELINLKFQDLDLKNYTITVKLGKGRKTRTAPFSPATAKAIWAYLEERKEIMRRIDPNYPSTPPPTDLVFINAKNKSIGRNNFWRTINRIGKRCGVHAHPHRFRHTFAIMYLRNGGNIVYLQQILGHSDLDMLKRYLAVTKTDLSDAHRRFSPVSNLGL